MQDDTNRSRLCAVRAASEKPSAVQPPMEMIVRSCECLLLSFDRKTGLESLIDADCPTRNPVKTESVLTCQIRFAEFESSAKAIGINRSQTNEEGKCNRANRDAANEVFGKTKLATQKAVNRRAN